jgi:ATP-binding cassette subfamily B protein
VVSLNLVATGQINIGQLVLIQLYYINIIMSLWGVPRVVRRIEQSFADSTEMTEILYMKPEIKDPSKPLMCNIKNGSIEFDNVTFDHKDAGESDPLFEKLSFKIKNGEKIGLAGPSGGGKTTLTKLILRMSDIDNGTIKIDRQDISKLEQTDLRECITYVPQEPILFHRSLLENISYGNPNASLDDCVGSAVQAHADEFISSLKDGYDTLVGERGVKLSGGQRQRVAIARAMLKDAPILILDEATSALDSESEKLIQDALWKLMQDRTAIVIAHRLSTIQKLDRILVLDKGQIVEEGSHKDLIAKKGLYAKLWEHQTGGFLED